VKRGKKGLRSNRVRKRDLVDLMSGRPRTEREPASLPDDPGSTGRRLAWAVAGMAAFFAAMHLFGWA
jgi:hypothetical protein